MAIAAPPLTLRTKLLFGFGSLSTGAVSVAFSAYLLLFYNQVIGISAGLVSTAMLLALLVDALADPIVGQVSDNMRSRWGRRHPMMYISAVPTAVAFALLFMPPSGWSEGEMFWWIFGLSTMVRISSTLYEIPSLALTPELSADYDQRTSLMSWRYFFGYIGGFGTATLALALFLRPSPTHPIGQLNPDGYAMYGLAGAAVIAVSILVSSLGTHSRIPFVRQASERSKMSFAGHFREMIVTVGHRGFLAILAFGVLKFTAIGLYGGMALYFGTFLWELGPNELAILTIDGVVSITVALLVAKRLSQRFGKRTVAIVMALAGVTIGVSPLVLREYGMFLPNGDPRLVWVLFAIQAIYGTFAAISSILVASMVADVVEDSAIRTGRHSSGLFFAASAFMQKCTGALGIVAAGALLTFVQFPRGAKPGTVSPEIIDALARTYVPVVMVLWFVGVCFLTFYRIDRTSHEANLRKLEAA